MTECLIDDEQEGFRSDQIGEKTWGKIRRVYVDFMDLKKAYDRVKKTLCLVLKMHNVGSKQLKGIKSMYVKSLVCVRVKGD